MDLPEPRLHVKFGKHHSFTQSMDQVILIGNRIPNPLQNLIQGFVVNYQSRGSSFNLSIFLDIKSKTRPRGLAIPNQFFLQRIMDLFFAKFNSFSIHLNRTSFGGNVFLIKIFNIWQVNNMFLPMPKSIRNIRADIINQHFLKIINFGLQQFIRKLFSNFLVSNFLFKEVKMFDFSMDQI